jgi:hypothetical protein
MRLRHTQNNAGAFICVGVRSRCNPRVPCLVSNLQQEVNQMKDEYNFSNAEQGKFYVPVEDIQLPIYLDKDIIQYLNEKGMTKPENLQSLVNDLLRKDIEIAKRVTL